VPEALRHGGAEPDRGIEQRVGSGVEDGAEAVGVAGGQLGDRGAQVVGVRVHDRRARVDARDRIRRELVGGHRRERVVAPGRDSVQGRFDDDRRRRRV